MRSRPCAALVAALVAALLLVPAFAPAFATAFPAPRLVTLAGTMRDIETGAPIAGTVTIATSGEPARTVPTDAGGAFSATVPAAACTLTYEARGYATDSSSVHAEEGLRLEPTLARTGVRTAVRFDVRGLATASAVSTTVPPATISVYRTKLGRVDVVPFSDYCKHVLPAEWYSTWRPDSLMAGAVAVKNYAWYWIVKADAGAGKWAGKYDADVVDTTADQVYDPAVSAASTDAAVDATWSWRLVSGGQLLQAQYVAGSPGQDRDAAYPTRLTQWGTQYWAGLGFDWRWILQHYYGTSELQLAVSSTKTVRFTPLAGADRYATAVAVSEHAFPAGAPAAVVAVGSAFPDALCAAPLARAVRGPVLLTRTADLDDVTVAELQRLAPATVYVVGSSGSVSDAAFAHIQALPFAPQVKRLGGVDRFETAAKVAEELRAKTGAPSRVVVATGSGFADALSAAPLAAAKGWPILLTKAAALPTVTADAVKASGATSSLIVGSERSVSAGVAASLPVPFRAGGTDRYATCALIADFARQQGCGYGKVAVATGVTFPDALAAGPMLAPDAGLVLLASRTELPAALRTRLAANKASVTEVHVVGKPTSVPARAVADVEAALR